MKIHHNNIFKIHHRKRIQNMHREFIKNLKIYKTLWIKGHKKIPILIKRPMMILNHSSKDLFLYFILIKDKDHWELVDHREVISLLNLAFKKKKLNLKINRLIQRIFKQLTDIQKFEWFEEKSKTNLFISVKMNLIKH